MYLLRIENNEHDPDPAIKRKLLLRENEIAGAVGFFNRHRLRMWCSINSGVRFGDQAQDNDFSAPAKRKRFTFCVFRSGFELKTFFIDLITNVTTHT